MEPNYGTVSCLVLHSRKSEADQKLYEQLYLPAITRAGLAVETLDPRVHNSSVASLAEAVESAHICFAYLTGTDPVIWMALGYALALRKPICLVADTITAKDSVIRVIPGIIPYPDHPLPSDYEALRDRITARLLQIRPAGEVAEQSLSTGSQEQESRAPVKHAPDGWTAARATSTDPIKFYEHLALKIICNLALPTGMTLKQLAQTMNGYGLSQATSVAVSSLKRRKFIQRTTEAVSVNDLPDVLIVTDAGRHWLESHGRSSEMPHVPTQPESMDMAALVSEL